MSAPSFYKKHGSSVSGIIDSIQEVTITIGASSTSNTATINSVDTNRSIILYQPWNCHASANTGVQYCSPHVQLTNGTTVTATRGNQDGSTTVTITCWVIQFKSGVLASNVQRGVKTSISSSATQAVSAVTLNRAYASNLGYIHASNAGSEGCQTNGRTYLNSTTSVTIDIHNGPGSGVASSWEVYEFDSNYCEYVYPDDGLLSSCFVPSQGTNATAEKKNTTNNGGNNAGGAANVAYGDLSNLLLIPNGYQNSGANQGYNDRICVPMYSSMGAVAERGFANTSNTSAQLHHKTIQLKSPAIKRIVLGRVVLGTGATTADGDTIPGDAPNPAKVAIINLGHIGDSSYTQNSNAYNFHINHIRLSYDSTDKQVRATRGATGGGTNFYQYYLFIEFN